MKQSICIGQQYGSGGRELGSKLAERLGTVCYDKLLMKLASEKSGVALDVIEKEEECHE